MPQGSVLHPIYFFLFIYINGSSRCTNLLFLLLFAVDTTTFISGKNINDLETALNQELDMWLTGSNATSSYWTLAKLIGGREGSFKNLHWHSPSSNKISLYASCHSHRYDHTHPLFTTLTLLKLLDIVYLHTWQFEYGAFHLFSIKCSFHVLEHNNTRKELTLKIPLCRTSHAPRHGANTSEYQRHVTHCKINKKYLLPKFKKKKYDSQIQWGTK